MSRAGSDARVTIGSEDNDDLVTQGKRRRRKARRERLIFPKAAAGVAGECDIPLMPRQLKKYAHIPKIREIFP